MKYPYVHSGSQEAERFKNLKKPVAREISFGKVSVLIRSEYLRESEIDAREAAKVGKKIEIQGLTV